MPGTVIDESKTSKASVPLSTKSDVTTPSIVHSEETNDINDTKTTNNANSSNTKMPISTTSSSFPHLVFGYGSLICPDSRAVTAPSTVGRDVIPVQVFNVERTWAKQSQRGMTAMGVQFRDGAECVGVLVPVTTKELKQFDKREIGYYRARLELDEVMPVPFLDPEEYQDTFLEEAAVALAEANAEEGEEQEGKEAEEAEGQEATTELEALEQVSESDEDEEAGKTEYVPKIWVYVQKKPTPATEPFPIAQSYVDIILRGCLTISKRFAREFIETTKGWDPNELIEDEDEEEDDDDDTMEVEEETKNAMPNEVVWVNDRHDPIYMRADQEYSLENAEKIDGILKQHLPETMQKRRRRRRRKGKSKKKSITKAVESPEKAACVVPAK